MTERSDDGPDVVSTKTTLFCPSCPYSARFDGPWRVVESLKSTRYRCPECGETVVIQPTDAAPLDPFGYWRNALRAWEAGVEFWERLPESSPG